MSSQIDQICKDAVAQIAPDLEEGLRGNNKLGFHIAILSATTERIIFEQGFGKKYTGGGGCYRTIALQKAEVVMKEKRSLSDLMDDGEHTEMHNGGFIDGDIVVAVAGAGHLGNVSYGRQVLRHLLQHLPDLKALAA